ncbi:MAG: hypothetical protein WDM77_08600 [Steroidobacteraceae bacterium]
MRGIAASLSRTGSRCRIGHGGGRDDRYQHHGDSFRESLRDWLSHTLQADIYVGAPGPGFARPERRLDAALTADLVRVPGVAGYSASRRAMVDSDRGPLILDAMDLTPALRTGMDLISATSQVWPDLPGRRGAGRAAAGVSPQPQPRGSFAADDRAGSAQFPHCRGVPRIRE